jgi:hypothetical protein
VPVGFLSFLAAWRRPAIAIAACLILLQTFIVGVAVAQAAVHHRQTLIGGLICNGKPGAPAVPGGSIPDGDQHHTLCCAFCTMTTAATLPSSEAVARLTKPEHRCGASIRRDIAISVTWRAVRAGTSQAPPNLA